MAAYDVNQKPGETLEKYYKRLAKTADQRLVRLEKLAKQPNYEPAELWAYRRARLDITKWNGGKSPELYRFNANMPKDPEKLLAKINDIKTFLTRPTSTKKGITEVYKKRAETINRKFGTNFSWQQMAKYFQSGAAEYWDSKYGSKTALRVMAVLQRNKDKIAKAVGKVDIKDIDTTGASNVVIGKVKELLKENNLKLKDLV